MSDKREVTRTTNQLNTADWHNPLLTNLKPLLSLPHLMYSEDKRKEKRSETRERVKKGSTRDMSEKRHAQHRHGETARTGQKNLFEQIYR